ncbi:Na/Pi cotransporter family protein [Fuchsiella alkaliacetigena]|uniref:Na/Pi cotransporter family protein n=1 Tax=Fuchsiella alkaliacetigena TaxID=957042 RepID=UPI00200A6201|nr:Na/Pi cotransporter family protein [Fuchsiella alkaliacetigena]MCK8823479.1 Na/Pi cotransporter family protein [Fuchsiella alkaliacetigena]
MPVDIIFNFIGGLGLFVYGMKQMGDGLQKTAGNKLRGLLQMLTPNRVAGVLVGAGITSIIQSSSAATVMVVGFVNAGLMTLKQSIGVIMGANIGTTITAQLIAFRLSDYALYAVAIGAFTYLFSSERKIKYVGQVLLGFGILFLGMSIMEDTMRPLRDSQVFIDLMESFGAKPFLGVLIGAVVTIVLQSSTASMGILIGLVSVGALSYQMAVPIILGENIGTTVTALLSSIGTNTAAKRSALAHLIFNVIGSLAFVTVIYTVPNLPAIMEVTLVRISNYFGHSISPGRMLANTHSAFNVLNTLLWLPFVGVMVKIVTNLVPEKEIGVQRGIKYIDKRMLQTPGVALDQTHKELVRMAKLSRKSVAKAGDAFLKGDKDTIAEVKKLEDIIDDLEYSVVAFLAEISNQSLSEDDINRVNSFLNIVDAVESMGDHAENIVELAEYKLENELPFTEHAQEELRNMFDRGEEVLDYSIEALEDFDREKSMQILELEGKLDSLEKEYKDEHMQRLKDGQCYSVSGVVFLDVIHNVENLGDQATNIAHQILECFCNQ